MEKSSKDEELLIDHLIIMCTRTEENADLATIESMSSIAGSDSSEAFIRGCRTATSVFKEYLTDLKKEFYA